MSYLCPTAILTDIMVIRKINLQKQSSDKFTRSTGDDDEKEKPEQQSIESRLRSGDEEAYRLLFKQHYAVLCHIADLYVHDRFTAEGIVGDVFFHLWEAREHLIIRSSLRSYLARSVRNKCLDHIKSKHNKTEQPLSVTPEAEAAYGNQRVTDGNPLGDLLSRELENEIMTVVDNLPEECREVFRLSRFENKKSREIAEELGISVNTVKYHLKNAIKTLRERLKDHLPAVVIGLLSLLIN